MRKAITTAGRSPARRLAAVSAVAFSLWAAEAGTVAYWRLDAAAEGLDLRNAAGTNDALEVRNGGPSVSFRRPVALFPAWGDAPAETRGSHRDNGSVLFGASEAASRAFLCAPGLGRRLGLAGRFTVEGWIRTARDPAAGSWWLLAGARETGAGWMLSLRNDAGRVRFHLYADEGGGRPVLDRHFEAADMTGAFGWRHVALVYDASRGEAGVWELFLDGEPRGALANSVKPRGTPGFADFHLGGRAGGNTFEGQLDLWRISDEALPASRLLCRSVPRVLALWPLDAAADGSPDLTDASGRGCALRTGRDGGITAVPSDSALGSVAGSKARGSLRFEGGIGTRSVLVAPGLGWKCDLTNSFTVEGWIKKAGNPDERFWNVAGARDGANGWTLSLRPQNGRVKYHLHVSNVSVGGKLRFESFFANTDVTDLDAWQHVALVYDHLRHGAGVWELFLDGVSQGLIDNPSAPGGSHGWADLALGGRESFSNSLEGWLDGWRVSDGPLTSEQLLCDVRDRGTPDPPQPQPDPRSIASGAVIPDEGYCDQPYVGVLRDGSWVCVLTTGRGDEGDQGQHVVSTISLDKGRTWSKPVDIEPADGPEASWATCFVTPFDRVYAFYTYNGDRVTTLPGQTNRVKSAWHGWYAFKFSDDGGQTWSKERHRIPVRVTDADRRNPWKGGQCHFWGIDKPVVAEGTVYFAFTKLGAWFASEGEGWVVASDNLLTERNPARVAFRLLPKGDSGIRNPAFGPVQEEHNLTVLKGKELMCVYRTEGAPAQSVSRDGGTTWSLPERMTYGPGLRAIKSNRACPKLFRTKEGNYLFWYHNHGVPGWGNRNPVFVTGGTLKEDGYIRWAEPELLLYDADAKTGISYPDLIEQGGRFWFTETQKRVARVHEVSRTLLEGLWRQEVADEVSRDGLLVDFAHPGDRQRTFEVPEAFGHLDGGGLSVDLWVEIDNVAVRETLLSTLQGRRGVRVATSSLLREPTVQIELYDGDRQAVWQADPGLLKNDRLHHVVFICDTRAQLVSVVVDGVFCDGGEKRPFGWGRLPPALGHVAAASRATASSSVRRARLYDRALRTSEAVGNFRAGPGTESVKP